MGVSTNKKVLVHRFDRETLAGFVNPQSWLKPAGIELLTVDGTITLTPYGEVRMVVFVRDFDEGGPALPLIFATRPKMNGLWLRLRLRDGTVLDGVMANDLLQAAGEGFAITPPDPSYQNQRVWVPRAAIAEIRVLGVIGSPLRKPRRRRADASQLKMFDE